MEVVAIQVNGRENRSADLGLVVPLEQGRLAASGKGGFRGRRRRARRLVVLRAARPRRPGPMICRLIRILAGEGRFFLQFD